MKSVLCLCDRKPDLTEPSVIFLFIHGQKGAADGISGYGYMIFMNILFQMGKILNTGCIFFRNFHYCIKTSDRRAVYAAGQKRGHTQ